MPRNRVINCDNLRTISKVGLVQKVARLSSRRVPDLKRPIGYAPGESVSDSYASTSGESTAVGSIRESATAAQADYLRPGA